MYPYQQQYRPAYPAQRPSLQAIPRPKMGAVASMGWTDWLLLGGGAIVAGVGLNNIYGGVTTRKPNFVSIALGTVLTLTGVAVAGMEVSKMTSPAA